MLSLAPVLCGGASATNAIALEPAAPADGGRLVSPAELHQAAAQEVRRTLLPHARRVDISLPDSGLRGVVVDTRQGEAVLVARRLPDDTVARSRLVVWIDLVQGGVPRRSVAVPVSLQAWATAWVSRAEIRAGTRLQPDKLRSTEVDVARLDSPPWQGLPDGQVLRTPVGAGQVLLQRQVGPRLAVSRGERVDIVHRDGLLEVRMRAVALQDGEAGELLRFRTQSGAHLMARVIGSGVAETIR